jgi:hypothetical protein
MPAGVASCLKDSIKVRRHAFEIVMRADYLLPISVKRVQRRCRGQILDQIVFDDRKDSQQPVV